MSLKVCLGSGGGLSCLRLLHFMEVCLLAPAFWRSDVPRGLGQG